MRFLWQARAIVSIMQLCIKLFSYRLKVNLTRCSMCLILPSLSKPQQQSRGEVGRECQDAIHQDCVGEAHPLFWEDGRRGNVSPPEEFSAVEGFTEEKIKKGQFPCSDCIKCLDTVRSVSPEVGGGSLSVRPSQSSPPQPAGSASTSP